MLDWYSEVVRSKGERESIGVLFLLQLQAYLAPKKGFIKKKKKQHFYNVLSEKKTAREKKKIHAV